MSHRVVLPGPGEHSTLLPEREDIMLKRVAFVVVILALVAPVAASGQDPRAVNGKVLLGFLQTVSLPDTKCVDGQPADQTLPPYLPCSPGTTRAIGRSEVQIWMPVSPSHTVAELLNGPITFVVNCDMNGQYRGPCWGTFEWNVPGVGTWAGFWTAPIMDLVTYESKLSMVGFGSGGQINGKQLVIEGESAPGDWYITSSVRIR
jgi:hypothetical protein